MNDTKVRFPKGARPGDRITFTDATGSRRSTVRTGTILDRAPQGRAVGTTTVTEAGGYWFWVVPSRRRRTDPSFAIRVRYALDYRKRPDAHRDDGPYVVRSPIHGLRVSYSLSHAYELLAA